MPAQATSTSGHRHFFDRLCFASRQLCLHELLKFLWWLLIHRHTVFSIYSWIVHTIPTDRSAEKTSPHIKPIFLIFTRSPETLTTTSAKATYLYLLSAFTRYSHDWNQSFTEADWTDRRREADYVAKRFIFSARLLPHSSKLETRHSLPISYWSQLRAPSPPLINRARCTSNLYFFSK